MTAPKIAVYKFSSCAGCQLQFINFEDELLDMIGQVHISYFKEASSIEEDPPYDIGFVEGSITCEHEKERILKARKDCKVILALGACASVGSMNTLKNWRPVEEQIQRVYKHPEFINTFDKAYPIDHFIEIEGNIHGCPVDRVELREIVTAFLMKKRPFVRPHAVCVECKLKENECLLLARNELCLGSVTRGGCGAICTTHGRACFGCRGPNEDANPEGLVRIFRRLGYEDNEIERRFKYFSGVTPTFRKGAEASA
jgi:sulfhydrogenase subunit delta